MKKRIAKYKDLLNIIVRDNREEFVVANRYEKSIKYGHNYTKTTNDMGSYFDGRIIVRKSVARKLASANRGLKKKNPDLSFFVTYGYRLLEIQVLRFEKELKKCSSELLLTEKKEITHKKIAVPRVAGHPTGGAIDITLFNNKKNEFLDMGCMISDFSVKTNSTRVTFSDKITKKQSMNRLLLHDLLVEQGFCPFYEEWWHFSYGDKEWAWFYKKEYATYKQKKLNKINIIL